MMMNMIVAELAKAISVFIGLIGGAAIAWLTFRLNTRKDRISHRRLKLEELYCLVEELRNNAMMAHELHAYNVMTSNKESEAREYKNKAFASIPKIIMLIILYFPELSEYAKTIRSLQITTLEAFSLFAEQPVGDDDDRAERKPFYDKSIETTQLYADFTANLLDEISNISRRMMA